jgi:protein SHQ1
LNETIENLLISNYRRILVYPLYRNIKICHKIKKILIEILNLGRFSILKCLIKIKNIFDRNEPRFLLNVIYIDPLIKWIQKYACDNIFKIIKEKMMEINIDKNQLKLDLDMFEQDYLSQNPDVDADCMEED